MVIEDGVVETILREINDTVKVEKMKKLSADREGRSDIVWVKLGKKEDKNII